MRFEDNSVVFLIGIFFPLRLLVHVSHVGFPPFEKSDKEGACVCACVCLLAIVDAQAL